MSPFDVPINAADGSGLDPSLLQNRAVLVVNVAQGCGFAPQLEGLQRLQERFGDEGLTVLGVPCNQFAGQAPGSAEEVGAACAATYGTTFPITQMADVNGRRQHPLFERLTGVADSGGTAGEVEWNFEKFLVAPSGDVVGRFRSMIEPESPEIVDAIESVLP